MIELPNAVVKFNIINNRYKDFPEIASDIGNREFDINLPQEDFEKLINILKNGRTKENQTMIWYFDEGSDISDILDTNYNFIFKGMDKNYVLKNFKIENAIFEKLSSHTAKIVVVGGVRECVQKI